MKGIAKIICLIGLSILGLIALCGSYALFMSIPDILEWLSYYIGTTTTWVIFILAIVGFIGWCVSE